MATFTGQLISATYDAIIKTIDNDAIGSTAKQLTDGLGNVTPLYVSNTQIGIGITPTEALDVSGNIKASLSVIATTFSGDLNGTINTATTGVTQTVGNDTTKIATTAFVQESHVGKPTGSGTGGKIALWSGSGSSTVLTDSSITEESTQYLLTKDIRIFDPIPAITLQDSDSSGSASLGDIQWLDNAASQRAIISLNNAVLGIMSKHGGLTLGSNSSIALSIDGSQNAAFTEKVTSNSTITTDGGTTLTTKDYVDSVITAQELNFSGTSGTGSVDLDSQSFAVIGTANEIETSAGSQQLQIGLPDDVTIGRDLTVVREIQTFSLDVTAGASIEGLAVTGDSTFAGDVNIGNGVTAEKRLVIDCSNPVFALKETDQSADSRVWGMQGIASKLYFRAFNDAFSAATDVLILDRSGNAGIGVTPNASYSKLQVKAPASSYGFDLIGRDAGSNSESQITFWNSNQTTIQSAIYNVGQSLHLYVAGNDRLTIDSSGQILIGTDTPRGLTTIEQGNANTVGLVINATSSSYSPKLYLRDQGGAGYSEIQANNDLYLNATNVGIGINPIAKFQVNLTTDVNFTTTNSGAALRLNAVNDATTAAVPMELNGSYYNFLGSGLFYLSGAISSSAGATFGGNLQAENRLTLTDAAAGAVRYVITDETNTGTGILVLQAGGGSAAYGGALGMYANAHASKAGDVYAGISSGSGGSFRVNTSGTDNGTDLLTINQATGATFAGNLKLTAAGSATYFSLKGYLGDSFNFGTGETTDGVSYTINGAQAGTNGNYFRWLTQAGAATPVERMRITSAGQLLLPEIDKNDTRHIIFTGTQGTTGNAGAIGMWGNEVRLSSNWYYDGAQRKTIAANGMAVIGLSTGNSDALSYITFGVSNPTASGGPTERMRITSEGTLDVKANSNNVNGMTGIVSRMGSNCDNTTSYAFIVETGTANRCFIHGNGNIVNTNNSYGALSDERLKENIIDATPKLNDLMKVKVRNFSLKGDETKQIGVVAQELEDVFPSMINETKGSNPEDETLYKGVKYSVFVPILIKAIQELTAKVEMLEKNCNCK